MAFRKAAALMIAATAVVASLPTIAFASAGTTANEAVRSTFPTNTAQASSCSGNNSCASISGVTSHTAAGTGNDCPHYALCMYTGKSYTGKRFDMYSCNVRWSMYNWNGYGSAVNNESPAGYGFWFDQDGLQYAYIAPGWKYDSVDYVPIYTVMACAS
ncbi:peptidase inhibitor family I36 protein [Streptomyces sp. NPDC005065]|uniref:peptidase inhibitor family I36 protein n=1 Tax=Streptomyces sp. NPDC005065 TaxID=3154461 RepID=UPI0033BD5BF1